MKSCRTCGVEHPEDCFYRQSSGSLFADCKPCWRAKVRANRAANEDQYRQYERRRASLPHRVHARKEYSLTDHGRRTGNKAKRAYRDRNPIKEAAHNAVTNAVRDGRLEPMPCEKCGAAKAQAHHDDYSKPLVVRWLCTKHHAEWHRHNTPLCPQKEVA